MNNQSALSVINAAGCGGAPVTAYLKRSFSALPKRFRPVVNDRYIDVFRKSGAISASEFLNKTVKKTAGRNELLAGNDSEIVEHAKHCAKAAYLEGSKYLVPKMALDAMLQFAIGQKVAPPSDKITPQGRFNRLICDKWWRRAIRKAIGREVEGLAIDLGLVNKQKGQYASDETVSRRLRQKKRNRDLLKTVIAVNELGQEYTLEALSELGVSNPKLRRMELMTRIDGFDRIAKDLGHAADFYTITCPSKYHAIKSDGKPNPKFAGFTPKQGQQYLVSTWAKTRAYLAKNDVKIYGFRVAEAHHDGTPHWHMMLFYEAKHTDFVRATIKRYALKVDGDEFGADKARFDVKAIDRKKGSAAGYLSKYISKNIDGYGLDDDADFEGGDIAKNVDRVEAWAACWGVRQFQQIGGAPVGVWRELRRLGAVKDGLIGILSELQDAADSADWALYTTKQGGALVARKDLAARVRREWFSDLWSIYHGQGLEKVTGVLAGDEFEKTRLHDWALKRAFAPAWSSVNNCNQEKENLSDIVEKLDDFEAVKIRASMPMTEKYRHTGIFEGESISKFDKREFGLWK
ncbi:MAG: replication endonuclease [Pseudomonadota bacterium]